MAQNMVRKVLPFGLMILAMNSYGQIVFDSSKSTTTKVSSICSVTISSWALRTTWDKEDITFTPQSTQGKSVVTKTSVNSYDLDILFTVKPSTNVFSWKIIGADNFDFFYQPPLSQIDIDLGRKRPDNVVGSYAVYHKTKINGQYQTGKVFHIYRPKLIDKKGNEIWCEMNISNGVLKVTCPSMFLSTASYPVTLDPTFGTTSVGASNADLGSGIAKTGIGTLSDANATVNTISVYIGNTDASAHNIAAALYTTNASNQPVTRLGSSGSTTVNASSTGWVNCSVSISTGVGKYQIAAMGDTASVMNYYYDDPGGNFSAKTGLTFPTFPNPFNSIYDDVSKMSIYAIYTTGGGGATGTYNKVKNQVFRSE